MRKNIFLFLFILFFLLRIMPDEKRIRLATTTSLENSGLLDYLLPFFEKKKGIKIQTIAVGSGNAVKLGENGDVDCIIIHSRELEEYFVHKGYGVNKKEFMYNYFVIIGPKDDPAKIKDCKSVSEAFANIAKDKSPFVSRGDNSGTHLKEKEIWQLLKINPSLNKWYKESGTSMENTILIADNLNAYTLTDIATYLFLKGKTDLVILFEKDDILYNQYTIIAVNPARYKDIKYREVLIFIEWLLSNEAKELIKNYRINGQNLFYVIE